MSLSPDAVASVRVCCARRPPGVPEVSVFWQRQRPTTRLSIQAIQKNMARYAKAAGVTARCQSLRHTVASTLLEQGAELVTRQECLGPASMTSSAREARVAHRHVKQAYLRTMRNVLKQSKV